jgi:hypothetical protein
MSTSVLIEFETLYSRYSLRKRIQVFGRFDGSEFCYMNLAENRRVVTQYVAVHFKATNQ